MADVCGPFTLDELDAFGGVDQLAFSLDNPIWQQADTCVLDSSAAISSQGIAVADGNAILAFQGNISGAASINGNGFRIRNYNASITGNGSINANALRIRLFDGSIIGIGSISALGGVVFSSSGMINGIGSASLIAFSILNSQGIVIGVAKSLLDGKIIGEDWSIVPKGNEKWRNLGDGVCGPFTLDQLDIFGGVDLLPYSLDNPIYLRSDFCANAEVWQTVEQGVNTWLRKG